MEITLDPINISVVAPTGAGKTALISTVCDYIKSKENKAQGFTLTIENLPAREFNKFKEEIEARLSATNMELDVRLEGTSDITEYKFAINLEYDDYKISQPFCILDIPGAFVNDKISHEDTPNFKKFEDHLQKSRVMWIPVDATILCEAHTDEEKYVSEIIRAKSRLKEYVKEWVDFSNESQKKNYCDFVLVKCETYFSRDINSKFKMKNCIKRFEDNYRELINSFTANNKDRVACVAVETIGPVEVNNTKWDITHKSCKVSYSVKGTERKIEGADCLINDSISVAFESISERIKESIFVSLNEIDQLLKELENQMTELGKKTWWDRIKNIFDDNIDDLKKLIGQTEEEKISKQKECSALRSMQDRLTSLALSNNSDYYYKLSNV